MIKGIEGAEVRDLGGACKVTIGEREAGVSDVIVENLIEEIAITADILATDEPGESGGNGTPGPSITFLQNIDRLEENEIVNMETARIVTDETAGGGGLTGNVTDKGAKKYAGVE